MCKGKAVVMLGVDVPIKLGSPEAAEPASARMKYGSILRRNGMTLTFPPDAQM